jgi:hypothetical protein
MASPHHVDGAGYVVDDAYGGKQAVTRMLSLAAKDANIVKSVTCDEAWGSESSQSTPWWPEKLSNGG